ncbi:primary-amine oxidase [Acrasis kona]|uniref:Amine oxidase n=1 Tax=Acrasis kona TaxID=1008807 RepID=A0AAW2ZKY4_9EUKA
MNVQQVHEVELVEDNECNDSDDSEGTGPLINKTVPYKDATSRLDSKIVRTGLTIFNVAIFIGTVFLCFNIFMQRKSPLTSGILNTTSSITSGQNPHPLDPLTAGEIGVAVSVLNTYTSNQTPALSGGLYSLVTILEPTKASVLQWNTSVSINRKALVVYLTKPFGTTHTYEATVSITDQQVIDFKNITSTIKGQAPITSTETQDLLNVLKQNPAWTNAIALRGYGTQTPLTSFSELSCFPRGSSKTNNTDRLVWVECYHSSSNVWLTPVEGLSALVDICNNKVIQVIDDGVSPSRTVRSINRNRPVFSEVLSYQPGGPSFTISGHFVQWDGWKFHLKQDFKAGLVLSLVTFFDRNVMYQAYLSELITQHTDPYLGKMHREGLEIAEFGLGTFMVDVGSSCPSHAHKMTVEFATSNGGTRSVVGGACIFETYNGLLILRAKYSIRSFDYTFDIEFERGGSINYKVAVDGTGVIFTTHDREQFIVSANTSLYQSDHFFTFYLDIDVESDHNNAFMVKRREEVSKNGGTVFSKSGQYIHDTGAAKRNIDPSIIEFWAFVKVGAFNTATGNNVCYELQPGPHRHPFVTAGRTEYAGHHIWVTEFNDNKKFPAGSYANQGHGDGLVEWAKTPSNIYKSDIVAWYTMGVTNYPRQEDYPYVKKMVSEFKIVPYNFFEDNVSVNTYNK